jgi:hypothetical protein
VCGRISNDDKYSTLRAILARVGSFTGMLKEHIQLANNPLHEGKPFEPPEKRYGPR